MCNDAVTEFRQSMQKAPGIIKVSLDDSPTSPRDVDGSQFSRRQPGDRLQCTRRGSSSK